MRSYEEIRAEMRSLINAEDIDATSSVIEELEALSQEIASAWATALQAHLAHLDKRYQDTIDGYQAAAPVFEMHGDIEGIGFTLNGQGNCLKRIGREQESLELYDQAIELFERAGDKRGLARSYGNAANVMADLSDLDTALEYAERGVAYAEEVGEDKMLSVALLAVGNILHSKGQHEKALEVYFRVREIDIRRGSARDVGLVDNNIGSVFSSMGDQAQSVEYHHRSLDASVEGDDKRGMATSYSNLGSRYGTTGQYPEAMEYFQKAEALARENGFKRIEMSAHGNIGVVLFRMGEYQEAEQYYHEAFAMAEELGNVNAAALALWNLGERSLAVGHYEEAIEYFRQARERYAQHGYDESVVAVEIKLADAYVTHGDLETAKPLIERLRTVNPGNAEVRGARLLALGRFAQLTGDTDAARRHFIDALDVSASAQHRRQEASAHEALRDLAEATGDFPAYIEHNKRQQEITEEIAGKEASVRLAMLAKEREMMEEKMAREKERSLLYGALPQTVADRLIAGEDVSGDHYESVSILFLDIVRFTEISDRVPPGHVVHLLKAIFKVCDEVCQQHGLLKVKTIGDSYMAAAGIPEPFDDHVQRAARAAIDMMQRLDELQLTMPPELGDTSWTQDIGELKVRIGLHCGPVVAGIVGEERLQYDVWGDTVNTASRMESTGEAERIQVSSQFHEQLSNRAPSNCKTVERGTIDIKGKGSMTTYWLEGA